jgi:hypothetical protein
MRRSRTDRGTLRELQQRQRAFDVHLMRGDRRELGSRRQKRGKVEDQIDFEFGEDPIEQRGVGNGARELAENTRPERGIERRDVERDDWPPFL